MTPRERQQALLLRSKARSEVYALVNDILLSDTSPKNVIQHEAFKFVAAANLKKSREYKLQSETIERFLNSEKEA